MSDDARRARRLRRPDSAPADSSPRVEELDALLRQVDDLRLTLETDLSLAAAAVEADLPELAIEIIDSDRVALVHFEERALSRLSALARPRRSWVPAHAASIAVAAGLVGLLAGVLPQALAPQQPSTAPVSTEAAESLERLQDLADGGDTSAIRAASAQLHADLADVVAQAKSDPAAAQNALLLLSYEQHAIAASGDVAALRDVLVQSHALARLIRAALPVALRTTVPEPVLPAEAPQPKPSATASPKASAKPSPTSSPKASPTASPSASPSATPKGSNPLDNAPLQP